MEEIIVLVLVYHILCFSDWMTDPDAKTNLGFSFIAIVMSIMIFFHLFGTCFICFKLCKFLRRRRVIKNSFSLAYEIRLQKKFKKAVQSAKRLRKTIEFAPHNPFTIFQSSSDDSISSPIEQSQLESNNKQLTLNNNNRLVPRDDRKLIAGRHMQDQESSR